MLQYTMRIRASHVRAGYGRLEAIRDVSLDLQPGEFVGLVGPNGAGKSTLLRVLSGTLPLISGTVTLNDRPLSHFSARDLARNIAFVPQSEPTLFDFTVREVVLMGRHAYIHGIAGEKPEDFAAATRAMAATDTLSLADRPITTLSGGEHRRVLIARALAQEAPVLLLDEPTAHLDLSHQVELLTVIRKRVEHHDAAALAALHDLNLAATFCHRVLLMASGSIEAEGPIQTVFQQHILTRVYGGGIEVHRHPVTGSPIVLPAPPSSAAPAAPAPRIHVICGGGTGGALLSELVRRGCHVTAGVLNRMDTDDSVCAALGIERITEAPFSPISPSALEAATRLVHNADAVVVSEVPIGKGNLANLDLVFAALERGKPVFLMGDPSFAHRDFTGGLATSRWQQALAKGGRAITGLSQIRWEALQERGTTTAASQAQP
ncbi:MAG: ABC transporter ATP-binding protein [Chthonomonadales bacterium]